MNIDELIEKWWGQKGGAERSNLAAFIPDLCEVLELPRPGVAEKGRLGDYEYEGSAPSGSFRSLKATGSIDLYKRGCFVLEAKQSLLSEAQRKTPDLFDPAEAAPRAPSGARYDELMIKARRQAENYAKNLPGDHPPAPFLIVCDVGRAFEVYFDWSGNGRGYGFFPDKQSYRIELPDLRDEGVRDRLRAIWLDPASVDPRLRAAEVTRGVAKRLADVSKWLEEVQRLKTSGLSSRERSLAVEESALFLMRLLFCMFAEDIGLLPHDKFKAFLERSIDNDKLFANGLADLWQKMGAANPPNRFAHAIEDEVRYFNGGLFGEQATTYGLDKSSIGELFRAAKADWRRVEPAIFGTLLEQALTAEERAKLGAHYTPRPYVERLVQATIMDVLDEEWHAIIDPPPDADGNAAEFTPALADIAAFHDRIAALRILDPACGTGNFLYVAMELLQRLESDVIERIEQLGGRAAPRIGPHQFFGLELNPRAAKITELVLWIGWLRNRLHDDPDAVPEPVLAESASINFGRPGGYDAILARDATGDPDYAAPALAPWPEADFIVGNPPFIGKGEKMRLALGQAYLTALWSANKRVPKSANFVMQWWDRAADILIAPDSTLLRFGFVTTNTISQPFNRRVIERYTKSGSISLAFAVPDHPWTKASGAAQVRIAMTVGVPGSVEGLVERVQSERHTETDSPLVEVVSSRGSISSKLTTGVDTTSTQKLRANEGLATNGVLLAGRGFVLSEKDISLFGDEAFGKNRVIQPYLAGSELMQKPKDRSVINFSGLSEREAGLRAPLSLQHLLLTVAKARQKVANEKGTPDAIQYAKDWWLFAKQRSDFRDGINDLTKFIATTETTKYRIFQFVATETITDHMIVGIALDDEFHLGVLSSSIHRFWTMAMCGMMGVATIDQGHRYTKSEIFDTFPFPERNSNVAAFAADLDTHRQLALAEVPGLTITELYNLRDKLRGGAALSPADADRARVARARSSIACTNSSMPRSLRLMAGATNGRRRPCRRPKSSPGWWHSTPNAPPKRPRATYVGSARTIRNRVSARKPSCRPSAACRAPWQRP